MKAQKRVTLALLLALEIVLSRFLSISTPVVKIGFSFIPIAMVAMLYGPLWAGCTAALADFLGAIMFPIGPYFPGFTLTAALTGLLFGLCLHGGEQRWYRPVLAAVLNCVLISYLANSAMIAFITGNSVRSMLAARAIQLTVMLPLQSLVLRWRSRSGFIRRLIDHAQR